MQAALIFACVLQAVGGGGVQDPRCNVPEVHEIADAIVRESTEHDVKPDIVAAVMWHESRFKKYARGLRGEVGRMQLLRGGAVTGKYLKMSFRQLAETDVNTHLGVSYLSTYAHRCKTASQWLTVYNRGAGTLKACRSSSYSQGVLVDLRMGRRLEKQLWSEPVASGSEPSATDQTSPGYTSAGEGYSRTSYKELAILRASSVQIHELLPGGICCLDPAPTPSELRSEEWLAAPFAEPETAPAPLVSPPAPASRRTSRGR